MKILKFLDKYFEEILMCMFLLIIVVFMTMQVLARYIFGHALSFPEELCRYSFIWMSYLGVSYAVKTGGQIKVDILQTLLPSLKKPLEIFGDIMYMIFCLLMIGPGIQSVLQVMKLGTKSAAMELPMWMIYLSFLTGAILTCVRTIEKYVHSIWIHRKRR